MKQLYDSVSTDKQDYLDIEVNSIYQSLETLGDSITKTANTTSATVDQYLMF